MSVANIALLLAEALLYFTVMAALFRARHRYGIGLFMCALGVMHFLETYLAAVFYVATPFGSISPGSVILFSGKLVMLLLLYIKEDANAVRQPIYGLFLGNLLIVAMVLLLRQHAVLEAGPGRSPDLGFLDEMGGLMVWGTTLLLIDGIAIVLLYEHLGKWLGGRMFARIALSSAAILTFDQAGFYLVLRLLYGAPLDVLVGGWAAKMCAALLFSALVSAYLHLFERRGRAVAESLSDIFDALTYRERYEALLARTARDPVTGVLTRERFETAAPSALERARLTGSPLSVLLIDVDRFKSINDRFGHARGDEVLRQIAQEISVQAEAGHQVFRFGGEEFVVLCEHTAHPAAQLLGERLRLAVQLCSALGAGGKTTVSIGIATARNGAMDLDSLLAVADARLYAAKAAGRDCVVGEAQAVLGEDGARREASA